MNEIKINEKLSVKPANVHDSQINLSLLGIICYWDKGIFWIRLQGNKRHNGSVGEGIQATHQEHKAQSPFIQDPIYGETSLCILQGNVPLWSRNGSDGAKSESEGVLHCGMLLPCKDKIS